MKQVYHSNSTTNVHIRSQINKDKGSCYQLAEKYGVSKNTIFKWKNRTNLKIKPQNHTP